MDNVYSKKTDEEAISKIEKYCKNINDNVENISNNESIRVKNPKIKIDNNTLNTINNNVNNIKKIITDDNEGSLKICLKKIKDNIIEINNKTTEKKTKKDKLSSIFTVISLVVAVASLVVAFKSSDLAKRNYQLDVVINEEKKDFNGKPYIIPFKITQGKISKIYCALIYDDNILYKQINKDGEDDSFEINLLKDLDEEDKEKIEKKPLVQFAIVIFDINGNRTIKYFSKLNHKELNGFVANYDITSEEGVLENTIQHDLGRHIIEIDCTLTNEYTIQKKLDKEKEKPPFIEYKGERKFFDSLEARDIYNYIQRIKEDCK